jgi:coenzyme F420-reducing hydrogenase delta subunit
LSSAMAGQFAEATNEMDEQIAALGENPLKD